MQWWIDLIMFVFCGAILVASSLIARYLYKKGDDFWLIYLFPIGMIAAVIMGGTYS